MDWVSHYAAKGANASKDIGAGMNQIATGITSGYEGGMKELENQLGLLGKYGQTYLAQADAATAPAEKARLQSMAKDTADKALRVTQARYGENFLQGPRGGYSTPIMQDVEETQVLPLPGIGKRVVQKTIGDGTGDQSLIGKPYSPVKQDMQGHTVPTRPMQYPTETVTRKTQEQVGTNYNTEAMAALFGTFNKPEVEFKTIADGADGIILTNGVNTGTIHNEKSANSSVKMGADGSLWLTMPDGSYKQIAGPGMTQYQKEYQGPALAKTAEAATTRAGAAVTSANAATTRAGAAVTSANAAATRANAASSAMKGSWKTDSNGELVFMVNPTPENPQGSTIRSGTKAPVKGGKPFTQADLDTLMVAKAAQIRKDVVSQMTRGVGAYKEEDAPAIEAEIANRVNSLRSILETKLTPSGGTSKFDSFVERFDDAVKKRQTR